MKISELVRQAQTEDQCPPGKKWCPIMEQCVTPQQLGLRKQIVEFFKENSNPDDKQVHELAASLKISPHDLETQIYAVLSALLNK